ncbi:hypothetical protein G5I_05281 [Acromyrmex echinatior]|uniref:Uncharacterized protein n=1 Tax=Acromyrmex echinatior TaxID=103372 RepID=F4WI12_ACREC|nr:hypothetical protein G5I_05281 [Acromyrmex echinatior]
MLHSSATEVQGKCQLYCIRCSPDIHLTIPDVSDVCDQLFRHRRRTRIHPANNLAAHKRRLSASVNRQNGGKAINSGATSDRIKRKSWFSPSSSALCGSPHSPELDRTTQEIKQNDRPTDLSLSGARSKTKSRESRRRIGRGKARKKLVVVQRSRPSGRATWGASGDSSCPSVTAYLASWIENDPKVMDGLGAAWRNPDFAYPC